MRSYDKGIVSAAMFAQIADDYKAKNKPLNYMAAGIQQYANLSKKADALKVK